MDTRNKNLHFRSSQESSYCELVLPDIADFVVKQKAFRQSSVLSRHVLVGEVTHLLNASFLVGNSDLRKTPAFI